VTDRRDEGHANSLLIVAPLANEARLLRTAENWV